MYTYVQNPNTKGYSQVSDVTRLIKCNSIIRFISNNQAADKLKALEDTKHCRCSLELSCSVISMKLLLSRSDTYTPPPDSLETTAASVCCLNKRKIPNALFFSQAAPPDRIFAEQLTSQTTGLTHCLPHLEEFE